MGMKKPRPVLVTWLDANTCGGWAPLKEACASELSVIKQVGWIIHKDDKVLVLAHSEPVGDIIGYTTIPSGWVKKIQTLKES